MARDIDPESLFIFGCSTDVVHEASYVPFIFQSDAGEASSSSHLEERPKLRGRRTFNARGEEVVQEVSLMSRKYSQSNIIVHTTTLTGETTATGRGTRYHRSEAPAWFKFRETANLDIGFQGVYTQRREEDTHKNGAGAHP